MSINIAGLTPVEDPSYRYQMPRIMGKIEGRGNGIKTVLPNVLDVAASLNRDPAEVTKFFGCELGAQTTFTLEPELRAIVNGAHNAPILQNHLSKYIELFVLCKQCRLPETVYSIKNEALQQKCMACGNKAPCDLTHKLTTWILSQHKKSKDKVSDKDDKKARKEEKRQRKAAEEAAAADGTNATTSSVVDDSTPTTVFAIGASPEKEKKHKKDKDKDKEEKKKKKDKKKKDLEASHNDGDESSDDEVSDMKLAEHAIDRMTMWKNESTSNPTLTTNDIIEKLKEIHTLSGLKPKDRFIIFFGSYFNENAHREKQVEQYKTILKTLTPSSIHQRHMIAGLEWFCSTKQPSLLPYFPVLLKHMYDEELLDEETILSWNSDMGRNEYTADTSLITDLSLDKLKISAKPFCDWLESAGVEGEESDESDDEDEDEEDEEEINIDDI